MATSPSIGTGVARVRSARIPLFPSRPPSRPRVLWGRRACFASLFVARDDHLLDDETDHSFIQKNMRTNSRHLSDARSRQAPQAGLAPTKRRGRWLSVPPIPLPPKLTLALSLTRTRTVCVGFSSAPNGRPNGAAKAPVPPEQSTVVEQAL